MTSVSIFPFDYDPFVGNEATMPLYLLARQEKMLFQNLPLLQRKLEAMLEALDNDCRETLEVEFFGLQIYVDVVTRGWGYRSIELIAVDIMNADCDALNDGSDALHALLAESVNRLNAEMDRLHENQ